HDQARIPFVDNPLVGAPLGERLLTAIQVQGRYLGLMAWPARLSTDYSYPQIAPITSPLDPAFLASALGIAACLAPGAWAATRGARALRGPDGSPRSASRSTSSPSLSPRT